MSNPDTPQDVSDEFFSLAPRYRTKAYLRRLVETEVSRRTERLEREYSQRYDLGYAEGSQKGRERLLDELVLSVTGKLRTKRPDPKWGKNKQHGFKEGLDYSCAVITTKRNEIVKAGDAAA